MSSLPRQYSIEELIALRDSPLITKPENLPQMEQWMQPIERRSLANSQAQYFPIPVVLPTDFLAVQTPILNRNIAPASPDGLVYAP
jgi:hypothetical protein